MSKTKSTELTEMKILLINDYGYLQGGAEVQLQILKDELIKRGHNVRLFSSTAGLNTDNRINEYSCFGTLSRYRTILQTFNPWAFLKLKTILSEFNPDIVHVNIFLTQLSPLILKLLYDYPAIYHVQWYRSICPKGTKTLPDISECKFDWGTSCLTNKCLPLHDWIVLMLQMKLFKRWQSALNSYVTCSNHLKNILLQDGYNPVDVILNATPTTITRTSISENPTIAYAGRLVKEKGVNILISAFSNIVKQFPKSKLLIAGDGPERENIEKLINTLELKNNISLLGYLNKDQMENVFEEVWVQVVPSLWNEPFGVVTIEAMMRGIAVVASDSGGLRDIVIDGLTGYLARPGNIISLTDSINLVIQDRQKALSMGLVGHKIAIGRYTIKPITQSFIDLYKTVNKSFYTKNL